MAKNVSILDAMAALEALGVSLSDEQQKAIADAKSAALFDAAAKVIRNKVSDVDKHKYSAKAWVDDMFLLSHRMMEVSAITRQQGRGSITERMFAIETPNGKLKVSLTETVEG